MNVNLNKIRQAERVRRQNARSEQARIKAENEDLSADNERLQQRARRAEADLYNIMDSVHVLPERETGRIFARMIADMFKEPIFRQNLQELVDHLEERLLVRIDPHYGARAGVSLHLENKPLSGDIAFTVKIPEARITVLQDARQLEMMTGKRGPVVMDDRPLELVRYDGPTGPSGVPNVTRGLI